MSRLVDLIAWRTRTGWSIEASVKWVLVWVIQGKTKK